MGKNKVTLHNQTGGVEITITKPKEIMYIFYILLGISL